MKRKFKEVIDLFNLKANIYEEWYSTKRGFLVLKTETRGIDYFLPKHGLGIEIGAGTGIFSKLLTTKNRSIVCLDPSIRMLRHAKNKGLQTILGLAENPPIKDNCMDFVLIIASLEFINEPVKAFSSISSILKRDGVLIVLIINKNGYWVRYYKSLGDKAPLLSKANFFSFSEITNLLRRGGFEILDALATLVRYPDEISSESFKLYRDYKKYDKAGVFIIKAKRHKTS